MARSCEKKSVVKTTSEKVFQLLGVCKADGLGVPAKWGCFNPRILSENPIWLRVALFSSGCIDDKTNIACFTVFARRKIAHSRADDGILRHTPRGHGAASERNQFRLRACKAPCSAAPRWFVTGIMMGNLAVPVGQMQGRNQRPTELGRGFLTPQMACCHKRVPVSLSVADH